MTTLYQRFSLIAACVSLLLPSTARASVELHAHLFMNHAMTWMFNGDFDGPLAASSWTDRFSSQANPDSLKQSGIQVVVAALYAHPLFNLSLRESVRRQIDQAENFVRANPQWIIARSPSQAKQAIQEGKRVMILALEGIDGVIENDADIQEFVEKRGVRIVTFLHLMDDQFGGVAFLKGVRGLASPLAYIKNLLTGHREDGVRANSHGLTDRGRAFVRTLMKHGVWIDLAHASDAAQRELIPLMKEHGQPILYTHTSLRKYLGAERAIADWQIEEVKKTQGLIGLMPCEDMLEGTHVTPEEDCPRGCESSCDRGLPELVRQYRDLASRIGPESVVLGSDYNGGINHLRPSCGTGTSIDQRGLWNIGQVSELWESLRKSGAPVPKDPNAPVRALLDAWSKADPR